MTEVEATVRFPLVCRNYAELIEEATVTARHFFGTHAFSLSILIEEGPVNWQAMVTARPTGPTRSVAEDEGPCLRCKKYHNGIECADLLKRWDEAADARFDPDLA